MTLSRRRFLSAAGATAAGAALAGCGGDGDGGGSGGSGGGGSITLATWGSEQEVGAFRRIGEAWTRDSGVAVEVEVLPFEQFRSTIDSRLQSGDAPDLFRITYTDIGSYSSIGALADISSQLGDGFGDAFVPGLWQAVLSDGAPVGVPHHTDTSAFLFNKGHFARAGITEVPTSLDAAWTWEEFLAAMEEVKAANPGSTPFAMNWQLFGAYRWLNFLYQAGGSVYGDEELTEVTMTTPEARKALEFTKSFYDRGLHPANILVKRPTYPDEIFPTGRISAAFLGDFLLPGLEESVGTKFEYGATFLPRDVEAAADLGGNAVVVSADGENIDAAADFAKALVTQENMRTFCEETTVLPVRTDLVDATLDYAVRPDLMPVFQQQATTIPEDLVRTCISPGFAAINDALVQQLEACFATGQGVDETLQGLQTAIEQIDQQA